MLTRIQIEGINLPRLYIAESEADVYTARLNGIPYIKWKHGQEKLVRQLLRPTLEKMFPGISWNKVLGPKREVSSEVHIVSGRHVEEQAEADELYDKDEMLKMQLEYDQHVDELSHSWAYEKNEAGEYIRSVDTPSSWRDHPGGISLGYDQFTEDMLSIEDYVGDLSSSVNIEALQKLGLLPKFVGDITDNIKHNVSQALRWTEGYTKKLGYPLGKFRVAPELPNLIIIDVSWSIPDGIAATMLTLADTLRSQCNAELIITSARSGYYEAGAELPKPQTLRDYYGRSNEGREFFGILKKHIAGREFGHVISFGDYDNPGAFDLGMPTMANTKIHEVHHYHTMYEDTTGYARWVEECCPNVVRHFDRDWCKVISKKYKMEE